MRERITGYVSIAAASILWGSLPVVVTATDAPAMVLVAMRMGFGALTLGAFLVLFGRADLVPDRGRGLLAGMGVLLAVHWVLFFAALQTIGAAAVLIGYVFPVLVALSAPIVLGERREAHVLPLAMAGLAGLAVIMAPELAGGSPVGALLALGAAASATALILGARRMVAEVPGPVVAFWQYSVGALVLLGPAVVSASGTAVPWKVGVLLGVVYTALAGVLFFRAIGRVPAQEVGVLMYLEPVAAVLFVWAFRGDPPAVTDIVGGALVIASGVLLVTMSARAARSVTTEPVIY